VRSKAPMRGVGSEFGSIIGKKSQTKGICASDPRPMEAPYWGEETKDLDAFLTLTPRGCEPLKELAGWHDG